MNKIFTFFKNGWADFLNWFGKGCAVVVSNAKSIIEELAPIFEKDLLADGSQLLVATTTAITAAADPVAGIVAGAEALLPILVTQGISLSKEAAVTLSAMVSAKIAAATAAVNTGSASGTAAASGTGS